MKRKKALISSPLSAKTPEGIKENRIKAQQYAGLVSKILNCRAVSLYGFLPEFLDDNDPAERKLELDFGLMYLSTCDMLVICGDRISSDMEDEIKTALRLGILIFLFSPFIDCMSEFDTLAEIWTSPFPPGVVREIRLNIGIT
ncbi:MAG: DUF7768 domain-containing protein [Ruminiclostridium sp.]